MVTLFIYLIKYPRDDDFKVLQLTIKKCLNKQTSNGIQHKKINTEYMEGREGGQ